LAKKGSNQEFRQIYGIETNFLQYQGLIFGIHGYISQQQNISHDVVTYPFIPVNLQIFLINKKGTKNFYYILSKNDIISTGKRKWDASFEFDDDTWKTNCLFK